ncbi:MAG: bifunctional riboflavin kinase/FAD synthetase [Campylobacteraceae bacterium]|nr:bifunctional riboflavin kinase/FAD synthetase [Campylobacteraceae bacterium]
MKHSTALDKDKIDSIAIGNFDGIHLGHQQLINKLDTNGALLVIYRGIANITPGKNRSKFVKIPCFYLDFKEIKDYDCIGFLSYLKKEFPSLKKIVVGYDFKFGANRACDVYDLKKIFTGDIVVVNEFFIDGISVHSSVIREFLKNGEIKKANLFLGRVYSIKTKVIKGQGLGAKKLFPTLNVDIKQYIVPKNGVYATKVQINKKIYKSITFIGVRESTDGNFSCETYVIDKEILNIKEVEIFFLAFIRENRKFSSLEELKKQIKKDIEMAKKILK